MVNKHYGNYAQLQELVHLCGVQGRWRHIAKAVVARRNQRSGESANALRIGLEEIDQTVADQRDTLLQEVLKLLRRKAKIEVVERDAEKQRQSLVARIVGSGLITNS